MNYVRERALSWLLSQIMSHEASVARLRGIQNDAVNVDAQTLEARRMDDQIEIWRYLVRLVDADTGSSRRKSVKKRTAITLLPHDAEKR